MKIVFYRDKCIGCNVCVEHAPNSWELSEEDGKSCLKGSEKVKNFFVKDIKFEEEEENRKASKDCPVNIIKIS